LALSPYEIWRDIFATNAAQIDVALDAFIGRLEQLKRMLRNPAIESEFDHAAMAARSLRERS
jgi:prephenate dehydrogenase